MRTDIPEKLLKISDEIAARGNANLTRLTVLKKWFDYPRRLPPFAIWVASQATSRRGKTSGEVVGLYRPRLDNFAGLMLNPRNEFRVLGGSKFESEPVAAESQRPSI